MDKKKNTYQEILNYLESSDDPKDAKSLSDTSKNIIANNLELSSKTPPVSTWMNIQKEIDSHQKSSTKKENLLSIFINGLFQYKMTFAAAVSAAILLLAIFIYNPNNKNDIELVSLHNDKWQGLQKHSLLKNKNLQVKVNSDAKIVYYQMKGHYFFIQSGKLTFTSNFQTEQEKLYVKVQGAVITPIGTIFSTEVNKNISTINVESGKVNLLLESATGTMESHIYHSPEKITLSGTSLPNHLSPENQIQQIQKLTALIKKEPSDSKNIQIKKSIKNKIKVRLHLENGDRVTGLLEKQSNGMFHIRTSMGMLIIPEKNVTKKEQINNSIK